MPIPKCLAMKQIQCPYHMYGSDQRISARYRQRKIDKSPSTEIDRGTVGCQYGPRREARGGDFDEDSHRPQAVK
jgi:hypothetical protein